MINDIKHKPYSIANKEDSVELLKYKLSSAKKDARKNLLIGCLIVAVIAFVSGYILSDMSRGEVNALQSANNSLRVENERLKAQTPSENQ